MGWNYVYILGSERNDSWTTYIGFTTDLERRLATHNSGKGAKRTRGRKWILLYVERYKTRGEALSREWALKRNRKFRKSVIPS